MEGVEDKIEVSFESPSDAPVSPCGVVAQPDHANKEAKSVTHHL